MQQLIQIFEDSGWRFSTPSSTTTPLPAFAHGSLQPDKTTLGRWSVELSPEQVAQGVHRLHPHRYRTGLTEVTKERKVQRVVDQISKGVQRKGPHSGNGLGAVELNRLLTQ